VLALGALTGSLVLSALAGPPTLALLAGAGTDVDVGGLVARFALVVLLPLLAGLAVRALVPRLADIEDELGGLAAIVVVVLVYAAMSGSDEDAGSCRPRSRASSSCSSGAYPCWHGSRSPNRISG
jgi:bile acid:Na+ symporter, BASS family